MEYQELKYKTEKRYIERKMFRTKEEVLERIEALAEELEELRELYAKMPVDIGRWCPERRCPGGGVVGS